MCHNFPFSNQLEKNNAEKIYRIEIHKKLHTIIFVIRFYIHIQYYDAYIRCLYALYIIILYCYVLYTYFPYSISSTCYSQNCTHPLIVSSISPCIWITVKATRTKFKCFQVEHTHNISTNPIKNVLQTIIPFVLCVFHFFSYIYILFCVTHCYTHVHICRRQCYFILLLQTF